MIHSLISYVLLSLGLMASLALFLSIKGELRSIATKSRKRMEELARQIAEAPAPREPDPETIFIPASPRPGMNITKRVHAMRMVRRNEDVSHIAAALGVPRREVELLIRVQTMSAAGVRPSK